MFRPALTFPFALAALLGSASLEAKASVCDLQQAELPCPANRGEAIEAETAAPSGNESVKSEPTISRDPSKASRQRGKALPSGAIKAAS